MDQVQHPVRIHPDRLHAFCVAAMLRTGMREADAHVTADVLVTTDTWGTFTHGTKHLRSYLRKARVGGIDVTAVPNLISEGPAWAMVDSNKSMAMVPSVMAMNLAIQKAKSCGIGYAGVRHSTHFGAAGYYANMAVEHDMIGLAMSNVDTNMTAPGARGSVIGNNPFAYAAPAGEAYPVVLDVAMSAVAAGKIYSAQALGKTIPDNWLIDDDGLPTTDISNYPRVGSLLPMAGHKGYGLAVMVEVLAAVLTGAAVTKQVRGWMGPTIAELTDEGHAFIAIDIGAMMPITEFKARMDGMVREIQGAPKAKGSDRIYLPGEMEWERRADALVNGIALPRDVLDAVVGMGEDCGLDAKELY